MESQSQLEATYREIDINQFLEGVISNNHCLSVMSLSAGIVLVWGQLKFSYSPSPPVRLKTSLRRDVDPDIFIVTTMYDAIGRRRCPLRHF